MFFIVVALCLVGTAFAQVPGNDRCPDVKVDPNFDLSKYLGTWYEAEKFSTLHNFTSKCGASDYSADENGTIKVVKSKFTETTGKTLVIGIARVPNASEPAKLKVQLSSSSGIEGDYWVLGTDYSSFSVVFACSNSKFNNSQFAWILTRKQNPDASVIAKADAVIAKTKLNRSSFVKTDQTNCNTYDQ